MNILKNLIQIAGIIDWPEAQMLINAGVDWLGFPFRLPVNREDLSETQASEIIRRIPEPYAGVLITYLSQADEILSLAGHLGVTKIQLHGTVDIEEIRKLKLRAPDLCLIKSLIVRDGNQQELQDEMESYTPWVDAFITDTHDPLTGADGATGMTHDWRISRRLVSVSARPVILAGGLNPENIYSAITTVRPAGVDAHTGVEAETGRKDARKITRFVSEARRAFAQIT